MEANLTGPGVHAAYSDRVDPRTRRLIVSGVLIGLIAIVLVAAVWNQLS
jgi:hypothetical protein